MAARRLIFLLFVLFEVVTLEACPRVMTGHLISTRVDMKPQQPYEVIRNAILVTGGFEGPIEMYTGSGICEDQKYYRKDLPSGINVIFYDCYGTSQLSETGWFYSASLSGGREVLRPDVRSEMEMLAEEIRRVIEKTVPTAKLTTRAMETGYGFSLLPY